MPPTTSPPDPTMELWSNSTSGDILNNLTLSSADPTSNVIDDQRIRKLNEFQIIKAVVLAAVTVIIMLSVCKMVLQLFIRYSGKQDER